MNVWAFGWGRVGTYTTIDRSIEVTDGTAGQEKKEEVYLHCFFNSNYIDFEKEIALKF